MDFYLVVNPSTQILLSTFVFLSDRFLAFKPFIKGILYSDHSLMGEKDW